MTHTPHEPNTPHEPYKPYEPNKPQESIICNALYQDDLEYLQEEIDKANTLPKDYPIDHILSEEEAFNLYQEYLTMQKQANSDNSESKEDSEEHKSPPLKRLTFFEMALSPHTKLGMIHLLNLGVIFNIDFSTEGLGYLQKDLINFHPHFARLVEADIFYLYIVYLDKVYQQKDKYNRLTPYEMYTIYQMFEDNPELFATDIIYYNFIKEYCPKMFKFPALKEPLKKLKGTAGYEDYDPEYYARYIS